MKGILCFGDSITFGMGENGGWAGRLKKYFEPKGDHNAVYNLGIPGDTTTGLLKRFDKEAGSRVRYCWPGDKYLIVIAVGVNDTRGLNHPDKLQTKPEQFKKNIAKLIKKAKKYTKHIKFVGLTPVDEDITYPYEDTYFLNKRIKEYDKIIKDACRKSKVGYIDLFNQMKKNLLDDGLHPNSKGFDFIFKIIKKNLASWMK
jgi:lysophospholipase L1-like esterase